MAGHLISLPTGTITETVSTSVVATGVVGNFPLGTHQYEEGDSILVSFPNAAAALFSVGDQIRVTSTPAQFVSDAVITSIGSPGSTTTEIRFRLEHVIVARNNATISTLSIAEITGQITVPNEVIIPNGVSGFVTAIYEGDILASNVDTRGLTMRFGVAGTETTIPLRVGTLVPQNVGTATGSGVDSIPTSNTIFINDTVERFNIILND